jgi:hypothetical protein
MCVNGGFKGRGLLLQERGLLLCTVYPTVLRSAHDIPS